MMIVLDPEHIRSAHEFVKEMLEISPTPPTRMVGVRLLIACDMS